MNRLFSGGGTKIGWALTVATLVGAWTPRASAHGGLPRAFEIIVEPGNPKDVVLRSDVWGFFRTTDGGGTWQWTCAEVYGSSSLNANHENVLILPGGRVVVANEAKGVRVTDDFCTWKDISDLDGEFVKDVVASSDKLLVLTATYRVSDAGIGGIDGTLWQSTDGGDHFTRTGSPLPRTFGGSSLKLGSVDPKKVYVVGRTLELPGGVLERSDDAGGTWKASAFSVTNDQMVLRIAAVHPTREDVLFVWADLLEGYAQDEPDEIWGTGDGGQTWTKVYTGTGDLPGFAFSPDGTEMLLGGPRDGVQRAKVDDALAKGQSAFVQTSARPVWGLHWTDTGLTAGTDNYTAPGIPDFTYGESKDEGETFDGLMSICNVKHDACEAATSLGNACTGVFEQAEDGFLAGRCDVVADGGPKAPSTAGGPTHPKGGCAFAVSAPDGTDATRFGTAALCFIALSLGRFMNFRRKVVPASDPRG